MDIIIIIIIIIIYVFTSFWYKMGVTIPHLFLLTIIYIGYLIYRFKLYHGLKNISAFRYKMYSKFHIRRCFLV